MTDPSKTNSTPKENEKIAASNSKPKAKNCHYWRRQGIARLRKRKQPQTKDPNAPPPLQEPPPEEDSSDNESLTKQPPKKAAKVIVIPKTKHVVISKTQVDYSGRMIQLSEKAAALKDNQAITSTVARTHKKNSLKDSSFQTKLYQKEALTHTEEPCPDAATTNTEVVEPPKETEEINNETQSEEAKIDRDDEEKFYAFVKKTS